MLRFWSQHGKVDVEDRREEGKAEWATSSRHGEVKVDKDVSTTDLLDIIEADVAAAHA